MQENLMMTPAQRATDGAMKPDDWRNKQRLIAWELRKPEAKK
jgi:hypothetical protein